jgi:hypothetical protein
MGGAGRYMQITPFLVIPSLGENDYSLLRAQTKWFKLL